MALTTLKCQNMKLPAGKNELVVIDEVGKQLYFRVRKGNQKDWFFRGTLGKDKIKRGLGSFPLVSVAEARHRRDVCLQCVAKGIDPRDHFESLKQDNLMVSDDLYKFSTLFNDLIYHHTTLTDSKWSEAHVKRYTGIWNNYLAKELKDKSIHNTTHTELLNVLKKIKTDPVKLVSGKTDLNRYNRTTTAIYGKTLINMIYLFAIEERNFLGDNPIDKIRRNSIFKKGKVKHHEPVAEEDLGMFWHNLKTLPFNDMSAMTVLCITALRISSLVNAKWSWYSPARKVLNIPAEYMKRGEDFTTPLPKIVVQQLNELKEIRKPKKDDYIWLNTKDTGKMKDGRPLELIKRWCPYATAHGVRTILKLNLERSGKFQSLAISEQLHHINKNRVEAAYMKDYDWLEERFPIVDYMIEFFETHEKNYLALKNIGNKELA